MSSEINQRIKEWVGKKVFVQGTFPLPMPNGQVVYSPTAGKLVEVFDDGYSILEEGAQNPTFFFRANLRCIELLKEESGIVTPKKSLSLI